MNKIHLIIVIFISLFFFESCTTTARFNRHNSSTNKSPRRTMLRKKPKRISKTKTVKSLVNRKKMINTINKFLGVPYKWAGETYKGMDCSGFTKKVFELSEGVPLPHNTKLQAEYGKYINKTKKLIFGDLVFFRIRKRPLDHVGIYLGNNKIAHASSSRGVVIDDFSKKYYQEKFVFGKRLFIK